MFKSLFMIITICLPLFVDVFSNSSMSPNNLEVANQTYDKANNDIFISSGAPSRFLSETGISQNSQMLITGTRFVKGHDTIDFLHLLPDLHDARWVAIAHVVDYKPIGTAAAGAHHLPSVLVEAHDGKVELKVSEYCSNAEAEAYVNWMIWRVGVFSLALADETETIEVGELDFNYNNGGARFDITIEQNYAEIPFVFVQVQSASTNRNFVYLEDVTATNARGVVYFEDRASHGQGRLGYVIVPPIQVNATDRVMLSFSEETTAPNGVFTSKFHQKASCGSSVMICPVQPGGTHHHVASVHAHGITTGTIHHIACHNQKPTFFLSAGVKVNVMVQSSDSFCFEWTLADLALSDASVVHPEFHPLNVLRAPPATLIWMIVGGIVSVSLLVAGLYFLFQPPLPVGLQTGQQAGTPGMARGPPPPPGAAVAAFPSTPWNFAR